MQDFGAGRIFWKEWRAQRSFWFALVGMAVGLDLLFTLVSSGRRLATLDQLRAYDFVAIVLACSFATGSAAIAFAGEVEAKTIGLLQRIPMRASELFAGKLSLSLVGSYLLLVVAWLAGQVILLDPTLDWARALPGDIADERQWFLALLMAPLGFAVVSSLVSLVLRDVLLTSIVGGIATASVFAVPEIRHSLAYQVLSIAFVAVCDFLLAGRWIRDAGSGERGLFPQFARPRIGFRTTLQAGERTTATEWTRSAVAWQRAASSLMWKELQQAAPFCLKVWIAGIVTLLLVVFSKNLTRANEDGVSFVGLFLIAASPLLVGVAAVRAERRDGAFRLLADHGVSPHGLTVCKHLVWLALSLLVFGVILFLDRQFLAGDFVEVRRGASLWDFATVAASTRSAVYRMERIVPSVVGPLGLAAFYVVLLYALGYLAGILVPGAVSAFFISAISLLGLVLCWGSIVFFGIPFWWTVGLIPVICLAAAWARTPDWLVGRNTIGAWGKVAVVAVAPLIVMVAGIAIFRITEIPAVVIPESVREGGSAITTGLGPTAGSSLFAAAMQAALTGGPPPVGNKSQGTRILSDGWQFSTAADKQWVARNAGALKLALEASQLAGKPGGNPREIADQERNQLVSDPERFVWLVQLLLYNARKLESEGHLDEALDCYLAEARLTQRPDAALAWMDQWALKPGQTGARIKQAIRQFESMRPSTEALSSEILWDWRRDRFLLRQAVWHGSHANPDRQSVSEFWWMRWLFPWELVRLERLEDAVYAFDLEQARSVERELDASGFVTMTAERHDHWNPAAYPLNYWRTTLDPPEGLRMTLAGPEPYVDQLAMFRMRLIQLALIDFKREHHKLPDSLHELVPAYFDKLPVDPWGGRDFDYEPKGVRNALRFKTCQVDARNPFLASAGMSDARLVREPNGPYQVVRRFSESRYPTGWIEFPGPAIELSTSPNVPHLEQGNKKDLAK